MKNLRVIRIILSAVFFLVTALYFAVGPSVVPATRVAPGVQILPSAIAVSMGAVLFWIIISFLLGRVYCSSVCPLGTFQDIVGWLGKSNGRFHRVSSYRPPLAVRWVVLAVYVACLVAGVMAVPYWLEPWNVTRNVVSIADSQAIDTTWLTLGLGVGAGMVAGIVSLVFMAICALYTGRGYCTQICPIGTALGCFHDYTLFHIEIDPDRCTSCMKCEEVCKCHCIKVSGRYVDNSRCVRCFDCLDVCDNGAIRFQANRNRRGTPLLQTPNSKP